MLRLPSDPVSAFSAASVAAAALDEFILDPSSQPSKSDSEPLYDVRIPLPPIGEFDRRHPSIHPSNASHLPFLKRITILPPEDDPKLLDILRLARPFSYLPPYLYRGRVSCVRCKQQGYPFCYFISTGPPSSTHGCIETGSCLLCAYTYSPCRFETGPSKQGTLAMTWWPDVFSDEEDFPSESTHVPSHIESSSPSISDAPRSPNHGCRKRLRLGCLSPAESESDPQSPSTSSEAIFKIQFELDPLLLDSSRLPRMGEVLVINAGRIVRDAVIQDRFALYYNGNLTTANAAGDVTTFLEKHLDPIQKNLLDVIADTSSTNFGKALFQNELWDQWDLSYLRSSFIPLIPPNSAQRSLGQTQNECVDLTWSREQGIPGPGDLDHSLKELVNPSIWRNASYSADMVHTLLNILSKLVPKMMEGGMSLVLNTEACFPVMESITSHDIVLGIIKEDSEGASPLWTGYVMFTGRGRMGTLLLYHTSPQIHNIFGLASDLDADIISKRLRTSDGSPLPSHQCGLIVMQTLVVALSQLLSPQITPADPTPLDLVHNIPVRYSEDDCVKARLGFESGVNDIAEQLELVRKKARDRLEADRWRSTSIGMGTSLALTP